ncbi:hypothetical protein [Pseudomonas folii]|uniref:hypothetical protein n=1 Tax=Pseudomonas folii TaxID=2762593 RepID=UPI003CCD4C49
MGWLAYCCRGMMVGSVALGVAGVVERIVVDTLHYKGNYSDRLSIQAACVKGGTDDRSRRKASSGASFCRNRKWRWIESISMRNNSPAWERSPTSD